MKKSVLLLSLLTMLLAGCSQDELVYNQVNRVANKEFTATLEEDGNSRIYIGEENALLWTKDDQISIFAGSTVNSPYQFTGSTGDATATFSAVESTLSETGSSLDKNYAVYPYSSTTSITTEGVITTTLPAIQNYVANSFGLGANTMVAVTADVDDNQLNFKNACGYLKFQLYGTDVTVKSITLTGKNNEKLAGTATITPDATKVLDVAMSNDATGSITLNCGANGKSIGTSSDNATAFWMVVPPVTFSNGFTVTVETTDDKTFTQSTDKQIVIERNKIATMVALEVKEKPAVTLSLPKGSNFSNKLQKFVEKYNTLTKIKFIANSPTTSDDILVTDEDGTVAYMVANGEWLEIHTIGTKFIANQDCSNMFLNLPKVTEIDFGDIFDTSEVVIMRSMFAGNQWNDYSSLKSLDLSKFNTSKVTDMNRMFIHCNSLVSLNLNNFDTSKVTDMNYMFYNCSKLVSLNIGNFDTSNVTNMNSMIRECRELTSLDVSNFDTSNVTDMGYMFHECKNLTSLDVSKFNTSNVTNMNSMFNRCENLTSLDVSKFNTSKVTDMGMMFQNCRKLTSLDVSNFDTSNVTNISQMFYSCENLTSLDVSNFDTSKVTDMHYMFYNCFKLTSLDVSNFDTSKVTNMQAMFRGCKNLTSLDVSNFDTSNVTNMGSMFHECKNLTSLDVSKFNTSKVTNMSEMFCCCSNLTFLNLANFTFANNVYINDMFSEIDNLSVIVTEEGYNYLYTRKKACGFSDSSKFVQLDGITPWA